MNKLDRLRKIAETLRKDYRAEKVMLYGSYARGEATDDSDIDILVIAPTTERMIERMTSVSRIVRTLRNGLPISPIVLTPEELRRRLDMQDAFFQTIMEDGIVL